VLPFTWVDCSALSRFLGSGLANASRARRDNMFGRALARLAAHEFYHVLAQTSDHSVAGIAKASLSVADLETAHFAFDSVALARFHSQALHVTPQLTARHSTPGGLYVHP
jgi:hypothetical protein